MASLLLITGAVFLVLHAADYCGLPSTAIITGTLLVAAAGLFITARHQHGGIERHHLEMGAAPPSKSVILLAEFSGPEPLKYGVTDAIRYALLEAARSDGNAEIVDLGHSIDGAHALQKAISAGNDKHADVVVWGLYRDPGSVVHIEFHLAALDAVPEL